MSFSHECADGVGHSGSEKELGERSPNSDQVRCIYLHAIPFGKGISLSSPQIWVQ